MKKKVLAIAAALCITAGSFAQMIDYSLIPYRSGDKWGYASADRKIVIPPKYSGAEWFSEGLAAVKVGSKWGYINRSGKMVIPARYTVAKSFRKGYVPSAGKDGGDSVLFAGASTTADGYERCITTKGVTLTKCPAISENSVAENRIPVESIRRQKTYSLPNSSGLFDVVVDDYKIPGSDETYYVAQKGGMYGVFNSKFETIVPFEYSSVKQMRSADNQYLQVQRNGMYGMLRGDGMADITPDYQSLKIIRGKGETDYVIVTRDGRSYVKDMMGNDVVANGYSDVSYDDGGFVITDANNMKGYYFLDKRVIAPKYSDVRMVGSGRYLQIKTSNGKVGYISPQGDEYFAE